MPGDAWFDVRLSPLTASAECLRVQERASTRTRKDPLASPRCCKRTKEQNHGKR